LRFKLLIEKSIVFSILLFSLLSYSQTKTITGVVSDTLNSPLENANIIAKPFQTNEQLKFTIADNKGRFKIELENTVKYQLTVSYIGYQEATLIVEPNNTITTHNFILKNKGKTLKEVTIKYVPKPVLIKKDTMIFDVKSFANGNERKMKDLLEKLPGVEVSKNGGVTVQGKKVTKMLVEGKSFFGGGSKLAVENIPADALDKIEVIDHFNEVGFMKKVSDSDDLVMNVKLKEDKKKFVFGDIEAGVEVAGDNGFYLAHAGLFYYSPKTNVSYIGDSNNIGQSTFTFQDLLRFDSGASSFLTGRKSTTGLYSFIDDNTDVVTNKSQFSAFNFSHDASLKLRVSGYALFSKVFTASRTEISNDYFQNSLVTTEKKSELNENKSILGIGNLKLDYSPNSKEKIYYNSQFQSSNNDIKNTLNSITNNKSSLFETISEADNISFKQFIEWHKEHNENRTSTFVVNHAYETNTPENHLLTNNPFLTGILPLQKDSLYIIQQIKKVKNNSVDAMFKQYWILNKFNHIYTNIGNNYGASHLVTNEEQVLTNGTKNDFSSSGFGNDITYELNDAYIGLEYKFKIGKWINKPGLYFHWYHLNTFQDLDNSVDKTLFQPQWNSDYEFSQSENIKFEYQLSNTFPEVSQYANRYSLINYNTIFKGNALLQNEKFHLAYLRYTRTNMYRGILINAMLNFNKKIKTIRNEIILNGINQYSTPIQTGNPETNWRLNGTIGKKIYRFNLKLNANLTWLNYTQTLNTITTNNNQNNRELGLTLKTVYKKWPDFSIGYTKGLSHFSGLTESKYQTDAFNSDFETTLWKSWIYSFEYQYLKNTNDNNQSNDYDIANTSLRYEKKNSAFTFELSVNNLFNIKTKSNYTFSDYIISQQLTYIVPRVILFSVSYKL
jgi:hypothetical protein